MWRRFLERFVKVSESLRVDEAAALQVVTPPGTDWFGQLPVPVQQAMQACMRRQKFNAGQAIYVEGDRGEAVYRIVSGKVRIRTLSSCGKEVLMVIWGPGHCIGSLSVLDGGRRQNDAIADGPVVLDTLPLADFHRLAMLHVEVYRAVATSCAMWIRDIHTMFAGGFTLEERLARRLDFLLDFGTSYPDHSAAGSLRIDLTQEMLASSVAVSRQAISKLLRKWQDAGVIDFHYGSVLVLDRSRLRRLAGKRLS